jgi:hypothetical protein
MASIEPPSATAIGIDRDIPITAATPRTLREAVRVEPFKALACRVPYVSSISVKVLVRPALRMLLVGRVEATTFKLDVRY